MHEGPAVFLRGRRVHHDGGARADRLGQGGLQPEIATKACVTRCRGQRGDIQGMAFRQAGKPCLQFFQPGVVPGSSRGGGRGGRGSDTPLLKGTQREYLLQSGQLQEIEIRLEQLEKFDEIRVINALNEL